MSGTDDRPGHAGDDQLFDDIREFLTEQSSDRLYEDLSQAVSLARGFVERELHGIDEYERMLRALERLVDDMFGTEIVGVSRTQLAEGLYLYGLAHYSLLQQVIGMSHDGDDALSDDDSSSPLVIYDVWFPRDIAIERAEDGLYLHVSDGRIDVSIYLGTTPNERGALVDLVDHWGYAASNVGPTERDTEHNSGVPMLTIELDYAGSELVDAHDHVDILLFDDDGEPIVRMHARASDLRAIVDELQAAERDDTL